MNETACGAPLRLAVLISGGGTTLRNLIAEIAAGRLGAKIVLVISSRVEVAGLQHAANHGIPTSVVKRKDFDDDEAFGQDIFSQCREADVDYVVMAGFLRFAPIPTDFTNRVLNIHPGLIPAFCGKGFYGHRVHEAVLEYGAKLSGCTVHFVDNVYDHGPIILQKAVPVREDDTPETLAARVFESECAAYPEVLRMLVEGRVRVEDRRVLILPAV